MYIATLQASTSTLLPYHAISVGAGVGGDLRRNTICARRPGDAGQDCGRYIHIPSKS